MNPNNVIEWPEQAIWFPSETPPYERAWNRVRKHRDGFQVKQRTIMALSKPEDFQEWMEHIQLETKDWIDSLINVNPNYNGDGGELVITGWTEPTPEEMLFIVSTYKNSLVVVSLFPSVNASPGNRLFIIAF